MTFYGGREGQESKPEKRKITPIKDRSIVGHCEPGDVVRLESGDLFVVTAWLNGGPMGRKRAADGGFGELVSICASETMVRLRGLR